MKLGKIDKTSTSFDTTNIAGFIQSKIGYVGTTSKDRGHNYGMCVSVLNKCQNVSYEGTNMTSRTYNDKNKVVENYLYRTLALIKAEQDRVLAEYAERCIADITSCLAQNGYDTSANANQLANTAATRACGAQINTCTHVSYGDVDEGHKQDIIDAATNDNHMSSDSNCKGFKSPNTYAGYANCVMENYKCNPGWEPDTVGKCKKTST
jgi:hypothetical protein